MYAQPHYAFRSKLQVVLKKKSCTKIPVVYWDKSCSILYTHNIWLCPSTTVPECTGLYMYFNKCTPPLEFPMNTKHFKQFPGIPASLMEG